MFLNGNPFENSNDVTFTGVPEGCDALLLAELVTQVGLVPSRAGSTHKILYVASDDAAMARTAEAVQFFAPDARVLILPAWDCLPYDRVPPRHDLMATRLATLSVLAEGNETDVPTLVLTTASAKNCTASSGCATAAAIPAPRKPMCCWDSLRRITWPICHRIYSTNTRP